MSNRMIKHVFDAPLLNCVVCSQLKVLQWSFALELDLHETLPRVTIITRIQHRTDRENALVRHGTPVTTVLKERMGISGSCRVLLDRLTLISE